MNNLDKLIDDIKNNNNLSFEESKSIFLEIMSGKVSEDSIYNFLVNLSKVPSVA